MLDSMFNDDETASQAKAEQTIARLAALRETGATWRWRPTT
jgi:hypothetical protein